MKRSTAIAILVLCTGLFILGQQLKIAHINVGQGDAVLITSPTGKTMLIDAGDTGKGTGKVLPYLQSAGVTRLDYVVATHLHSDHIGGMDEVINALGGANIGKVYDRGTAHTVPTTAAYTDYLAAANTAAGGHLTVAVGQTIDLGGGVTAQCVATDGSVLGAGTIPNATSSENDLSSAWVISYGSFKYFEGGDCGGESSAYADLETPIAAAIGAMDAIKVNHHGSTYSSNQYFVDTLHPSAAVIMVGNANGYYHPVQTILNRWMTANCILFLTETGNGGTVTYNKGWVASGNIFITTTGSTNFTVSFGTSSYTYALHTQAVYYTITGNVGASSATVSRGGATTTSDASGNYGFANLNAGTYTITPSKSGCTFAPASLSVTVGPSASGKNFTPTCGGGDTQLTSGTTLNGQSVGLAAWKYYYITVPAGATSLELKTTNATADIDIYTRVGAKPNLTTYDCRPYSSSGNESCTYPSPVAGTYWMGVYGDTAGSYSVTGTVVTGGALTEKLANGGFETITASTNTAPDGSWTRSAYTGTSFNTLLAGGTYPRTGTDHAYLGVNNTSSQKLDSAAVTIPATATQATLSFWVSIVTQETTTGDYDKLELQLVNASTGALIVSLGKLNNTNKTAGAATFVQKSYSVVSYKGQAVKVRFVSSCDGTLPTIFRVDDVSLMSN